MAQPGVRPDPPFGAVLSRRAPVAAGRSTLTLGRMDATDIAIVAEDLIHLRDDWGGEITDAQIRRGSAVLRRLLVEDAYGQAWRAAGLKESRQS